MNVYVAYRPPRSIVQETSPDVAVALDDVQMPIAKLFFDPHGNRHDTIHHPPVQTPRVVLACGNLNRFPKWTMRTDLPLAVQELQRLDRRFGPAGAMITRSWFQFFSPRSFRQIWRIKAPDPA